MHFGEISFQLSKLRLTTGLFKKFSKNGLLLEYDHAPAPATITCLIFIKNDQIHTFCRNKFHKNIQGSQSQNLSIIF